MHWFYYPSEISSAQSEIRFPSASSRQIRKVLHLKTGEMVVIFDDTSNCWLISIGNVYNKEGVTGRIVELLPKSENHTVKLNLAMAYIKLSRIKTVIQMAAELGVQKFHFFKSPFTQLSDMSLQKISSNKHEHLRNIAIEACELSHRSIIPQFKFNGDISEVTTKLNQNNIGFVLYEKEKCGNLQNTLNSLRDGIYESVTLFVGPVGGFSLDEIVSLKKQNIRSISIGKNVVRSDTAAITSVAIFANYFNL